MISDRTTTASPWLANPQINYALEQSIIRLSCSLEHFMGSRHGSCGTELPPNSKFCNKCGAHTALSRNDHIRDRQPPSFRLVDCPGRNVSKVRSELPSRRAISPGCQNVVISLKITALIVVTLFVGACALSTRRRLAAALCGAGLLIALMKLTIGVHTHGRVTRLDAATMSWFVAHRSAEFNSAASVITHLGSPSATTAAGLLCGAVLSWQARSVIPGAVVIGAVASAALAEAALKAVVVRPLAPVEQQFMTGDRTFRSGHVAGTGALLGIIAVWLGLGHSRTARAWLTGLVLAAVLVVAVARLYLGVHWLTDVIGGAVLAGAFVSLGAVVMPKAPEPAESTHPPGVKAD
jgi:membrane-associated phospholipid phosphatase